MTMRRGLALLAMLAVMAGCDDNKHGSGTVRMAIPSEAAGFWPTYVALKLGLYQAENLDVQLTTIDPNVTVSALIGGATDVSFADSTQFVFALDKGADLLAVGLSTEKPPYLLIARSSIASVAELKDKSIGAVSEIDVYTIVLQEMVRNAGLAPERDVHWIYGGNQAKRMSLIVGRQIDAAFFSPPTSSRLLEQGYVSLAFAPDLFPDLTLSVQAVRRDWALQHGPTLSHLLKAQSRALAWLYAPENRKQAITILSERTGAAPLDAEDAYKFFVETRIWGDGCVPRTGIRNVVDMLAQTHQLKRITDQDAARMADTQWCPAP